jgi:hypothetical protein
VAEPTTAEQDDRLPADCPQPPVRTRPLRAAEITAIGAGRRLYVADVIGAQATVNTILCLRPQLEPAELAALQQIGERSFGICARAGMLHQQASDLLAELRDHDLG